MKNAKLHLAGIVIQEFASRKRELTSFESAIYEAALKQTARALVSRGQVKQVLEDFEQELSKKRQIAEAARAAKAKKSEPPVLVKTPEAALASTHKDGGYLG